MASQSVKPIRIVLAAIVLSSVGMVLLHRFVPVPVTSLMLIRKAEARQEGRTLAIQHRWVPIEEVSPSLVAAVVNREDAHFYTHSGFDLDAIESAYLANEYFGYIVRGGSTISQQTAKNVFCTPARTYLRKAVEAYFTVLIEFFWGKERIMEVYLNVIEWGDGVFGVEAASQYYFQHPAIQLTTEEIDYLVSLIPNPRSRARHF